TNYVCSGDEGYQNAFEYYIEVRSEVTIPSAVAVPNIGAAGVTNYILLNAPATPGGYTLNGSAVTPTPVLTGDEDLVKIKVPAGAATAVLSDGSGTNTYNLATPGTDAGEVAYGETPMAFSEFYHDITAGLTDERPADTSFAAGGTAAEPVKFINAGTRSGGGPDGAGTTLTYAQADSRPAVDAVSSATYGDSAHFPPTGNLALNYADPMTKTDVNNKITGIKAVEVGVDFDLYANAYLLAAAGKATEQSAAVLGKVENVTAWKAAGAVYKAKYLLTDGNWGAREETANSAAISWPTEPLVSASYGGNWADRVVSVNYAPLPASISSTDLWNNYFEQAYGGYVEDLTTGQKEPVVWLQNLFSHRGHTNIEVALNRDGISRMNALTANGDFKFVIYAKGLEDIVVESIHLSDYEASEATIEQGSTFYAETSELLGANGLPLEEGDRLHIGGLSAKALADFDASGGLLLKGTAEVDASAYALNLVGGGGEIEIELLAPFFTGAFQGSYTVKINSATVYQMPSFTVNRVIERPALAGSEATEDDPLAVLVTDGAIAIDDEGFAKALVTSGRSGLSSIAIAEGGGTAPAITAVLTRPDTSSAYQINPSALEAGKTYKLTLLATNYVCSGDEGYQNAFEYYITVE
ncbi:MAG: hypothetical protein LBQ16_07250, partial [Gracilibacteraceae bacterium]|nr:hypothetical protein [Gracilibacteraceae bacterium]